ncbi:MAG: GTPase ObgE [Patescibacteria group bacterium]|nr:GTPase ObgE [Patescibacteria group bacterium]
MFVDTAEIVIKAGNGGNGLVAWRAEKFMPKGGPFGGDGGKGGNVIFQAVNNINTLTDFRARRKWLAENGQNGGIAKRHGRNGEDLIIKVPVGTLIYEVPMEKGKIETNLDDVENTNEYYETQFIGQAKVIETPKNKVLIADLTEEGQEYKIAEGGRGGYGNAHFTSSTRQAPNFAELGEPIEKRKIFLELKLVADIGIIGQPNAGKSTLISRLSNARPKIGNYPFTTLVPNLGVCNFYDDSFVLCDIPGLIKGAAKGKGLGHEFLRHIERCGALLHLVDATSADPVKDYKEIRAELKKYSKTLAEKHEIVALNKIDAVPDFTKLVKALKRASKKDVFAISAVTGQGIDELMPEIYKAAKQDRAQRTELQKERSGEPVLFQPHLDLYSDSWDLRKEKNTFYITGQRLEQIFAMTNWDQYEGRLRFFDVLKKKGILKALLKAGWQAGNPIKIKNKNIAEFMSEINV